MSSRNLQHIPVAGGRLGSWHWRIVREPLPRDQLARRYDRMAPRWGRLVNRLGYRRAYHALFTQLMNKYLAPSTDKTLAVLDCGIGTGSYAAALCDASPVSISLTGVDISTAMVSAAKTHLSSRGIDADVRQASIEQLPFEDQSFDIVIAAHVLEHLPDPATAFAEMRRVLRPGGWVVLSLTRRSLLGTYVQTKWRTHCVTAEQCHQWLAEAGLQPVPLQTEVGGTYSRTSLTCLGRKNDAQSPWETTE
ncbi:MAG: class I SAM-dependent methyltransferase [Pseudomonadota bacterium]